MDVSEVRAEQAYREEAVKEAAEAAKKKKQNEEEEAKDLGVSGLRRARRRQLLFSSYNANEEVSSGSAIATRAQKGKLEATTALQKRRRLAASSSSSSGAAHASDAVLAARAAALAEKEAAVALGWRGAWHEARRSKRKEKAEEWVQMQARGEVGQAVFRATLEQSLASDDDGTVKQ